MLHNYFFDWEKYTKGKTSQAWSAISQTSTDRQATAVIARCNISNQKAIRY